MHSILINKLYDSANHIRVDIISSFWGPGPLLTLAIAVGFSSLVGSLEVKYGLPRAVGLGYLIINIAKVASINDDRNGGGGGLGKADVVREVSKGCENADKGGRG